MLGFALNIAFFIINILVRIIISVIKLLMFLITAIITNFKTRNFLPAIMELIIFGVLLFFFIKFIIYMFC